MAKGWRGDKEGHRRAALKGWAKRLGLTMKRYEEYQKRKKEVQDRLDRLNKKLRALRREKQKYVREGHAVPGAITLELEDLERKKPHFEEELPGILENLRRYSYDDRRREQQEAIRKSAITALVRSRR